MVQIALLTIAYISEPEIHSQPGHSTDIKLFVRPSICTAITPHLRGCEDLLVCLCDSNLVLHAASFSESRHSEQYSTLSAWGTLDEQPCTDFGQVACTLDGQYRRRGRVCFEKV